MIETFIYIVVGVFILRAVLSLFVVYRDDDEDDEPEDLDRQLQKQGTALIQIKLEEINGWWYGFYHPKEGSEVFVAQGESYDEAVENCKVRLQDNNVLRNLKIEFK